RGHSGSELRSAGNASAAPKSRNRSLKFELILTKAFHRGGGDHKIPSRGEDPGVSEGLPEFDVKVPVGVLTAHEPLHDEAFAHCFHCIPPLSAPMANVCLQPPSAGFYNSFTL